jgi:hypothetical protein
VQPVRARGKVARAGTSADSTGREGNIRPWHEPTGHERGTADDDVAFAAGAELSHREAVTFVRGR